MSSTTLCRLCVKTCQEVKCLFDNQLRISEAYKIVVKYFDSKLLELGKEHFNLSVICLECWQHINDFHTFQELVNDSQAKLQYRKQPIKEEINIEPSKVSGFDIIHINSDTQEMLIDIAVSSSATRKTSISGTTQQTPIGMAVSSSATRETSISVKPIKVINNETSNVSAFDIIHINGETQETPKDDRVLLVRHLGESHNGNDDKNQFICEVCSQPFEQFSKLIEHYRQEHAGNDEYICETCGEVFERARSLLRHITRKHQNSPDIFQWICDECNQLFKCMSYYEMHMKSKHKNMTPIPVPHLFCNLCNKIFIEGNQAIWHVIKDHTNVQLNTNVRSYLHLIGQHHENISKMNLEQREIGNAKKDIIEIMSADETEDDEIKPNVGKAISINQQDQIHMPPLDLIEPKYEIMIQSDN